MVPVVALVGRRNVGKSTLFNRLTCNRDALVADFPGLTRDRKYGRAKVKGCEFICIDTGGIDGEGGIETRIVKQSLLAVKEADVVLLMVDVHTGLMPADSLIAKHLRSYKKMIFLVANKIDGTRADQAIVDFWSLGFSKIYPITSSNGYGVISMMESILLPFVNTMKQKEVDKINVYLTRFKEIQKNEDIDSNEGNLNQKYLPIKLAIVGRPNVGKSTLANFILGEERVVVYNMPGTTRDSIYIPMQRDKCEYVLIDTAGVRKQGKVIDLVEKFSVIKTLKAIEDANVVLLMIDASEGILGQDLCLLDFILSSGRSLVIVVNKWDCLSKEEKDQIKKILEYRFSFVDFARVHFISALYGIGVGNLFKSVHEAYDSSTRRQSTSILTRIMRMAVKKHQPPLMCGRRVKLKYAHPGGYNPPIVVIHGNQVKNLPDSYKRYLMNCFRKSLDIVGTPIRIEFKEGDNPFSKKRNILTR